MRILYTPSFVRQFKHLDDALKQEVREKIALFQKNPRHQSLKTHKLKGRLIGQYSFSVNYRYRIVFCYDKSDVVALFEVGDHDVYK